MPTYVFKCNKCSQVYEELTSYDPTGKYKDVKCPNCNSIKKVRTYDYDVACTFDDPKSSHKWEKFTYRAGHNMNAAQELRRTAEAKSHMGTDPYNFKKLG
jgi:DNA-directed RNA polymerase subunit RPC12/RpoP